MKTRAIKIATALLAGFAILFLAGCESKEAEPLPETVFRSLVKLTAGDAADGDLYGMSVAVSDSWAVVGAPAANGAGTDHGRAYIYQQSLGGTDAWGELIEIAAADAADGDFFGISVDISGDYAVVGAYEENGSGTNRGAAYVYYRLQGGENNWGQVKKLVAGDVADTNQFGYDVAVSGDTVLVGCPGEAGDGEKQGAAYVFTRDLGGADAWGQVKKIVPADPGDSTWFGTAVAVEGTMAVVGAAWDDSTMVNQGAAYVFYKDQGGLDVWGEIKKLRASDADEEDLFGYDVALDGAHILVGAFRAAGGGTERGQGYIFARDEGGADAWGEVQRLRSSDAANDDRFGYSVAIDGLFLLAGAMGEDGDGIDRGAAYVFKKF